MKVRQRHIGKVHPQVRDVVDNWVKVGKPFPSSGGFYYTVPNKSYEKVKALAEHPELRDSVRRLGLEEEFLRLWDIYCPMRYELSQQMLKSVQDGIDPDAFSRNNAEAGTGLHLRGRRLKRSQLVEVAGDLDFMLKYSFSAAIAFAATQLAELSPDSVWVIIVYDARIRGAIAARSAMDVLDVDWDGEHLTISGLAETRQAGSDGSGSLANSHTEKKLIGMSVTEKALREYKTDKVHYPFTNKEALIDVWSRDAKPFPGKRYVIGEDFGLMEPIKAPADACFSRAFVMIGGRLMPELVSGTGFTALVYGPFHNHFASKLAPSDKLICLGDDMNLDTDRTEESVFHPYIKVKSTDPQKNQKKILGLFTAQSESEDPDGKEQAMYGVVPRCIKTVSSASKRGTAWGESLSNVGDKGKLLLFQPEATLELVKQDMQILKPYMQWKGMRRDMEMRLHSTWANVPTEEWQVLKRYNEDIDHRMKAESGSSSDEED
jgi:hypothetical protein